MKFTLFVLVALVACVVAQDSEVKFVIDEFTEQTPALILLTPATGVPDPIAAFTRGNTIMGGERDLQLTVGSGDPNLILTTGVSGGAYTAATPNEARGNSLYQLDGVDGSMNLRTDGLFGSPNNDFTARSANAFRIVHETDLPGRIIFRIFSGSISNVCTYTLFTIGDDSTKVEIIPYSDFEGNCDFSNVGAIEIFIAMDDNIDVFISEFSTWGPEESCVCICPAFTCNTLEDLDGGDFDYYFTSQFGNFNPTTDLSSQFFTDGTITIPSGVTITVPSGTISIPSGTISVPSGTLSISLGDDDDDSSSSANDDDDDESNSGSSSSGSSSSADDDDDNNSGSSSSSGASMMTITAVVVLAAIAMF